MPTEGVSATPHEPNDGVSVTAHYAAEDQPECVQALLLLIGLDVRPPQQPPADTAK
jgi:hypothetical protein